MAITIACDLEEDHDEIQHPLLYAENGWGVAAIDSFNLPKGWFRIPFSSARNIIYSPQTTWIVPATASQGRSRFEDMTRGTVKEILGTIESKIPVRR